MHRKTKSSGKSIHWLHHNWLFIFSWFSLVFCMCSS